MRIIKCDICGEEYDDRELSYHIQCSNCDNYSNYKERHLYYDICPCCYTRVANFINSIRHEDKKDADPIRKRRASERLRDILNSL